LATLLLKSPAASSKESESRTRFAWIPKTFPALNLRSLRDGIRPTVTESVQGILRSILAEAVVAILPGNVVDVGVDIVADIPTAIVDDINHLLVLVKLL